MHLSSGSEVTLGLLIAFGLLVVYTRLKNWLTSNVPIIFYVLLIGYMESNEAPSVPLWLIFTACGLALMLRFEFMNGPFTKTIKFLELTALSVTLYLSVGMLIH